MHSIKESNLENKSESIEHWSSYSHIFVLKVLFVKIQCFHIS